MNNSTVGQNTASTMDKNIIQNNNFVGSGMSNNTPLLPVTNSWLQQQQPFPSQSIPSSATPSSAGSGTLVGSGVSPHPLTIEGKNPPIMGMGSAPVSGNYMNQSSSPSVRPHGKTLERPVPSVYEWLRWISRPRSLNLNDHIYFSLSQFSYHPFCLLPINPSIHPSIIFLVLIPISIIRTWNRALWHCGENGWVSHTNLTRSICSTPSSNLALTSIVFLWWYNYLKWRLPFVFFPISLDSRTSNLLFLLSPQTTINSIAAYFYLFLFLLLFYGWQRNGRGGRRRR